MGCLAVSDIHIGCDHDSGDDSMVSWCRSGKIGGAWFCAANFPVKELGLSLNISHVSGHSPTLHINADMIWINTGIAIKLYPERKQPGIADIITRIWPMGEGKAK